VIEIGDHRLQFVVSSGEEVKAGPHTRIITRKDTAVLQKDQGQLKGDENDKIRLKNDTRTQEVSGTKTEGKTESISSTRLIIYAACGILILGGWLYSLMIKNTPNEDQEQTFEAQAIPAAQPAGAVTIKDGYPPADSLQKAEECFKVAGHLAQDQTRAQNLYRAFLKLQEGLVVLDQFTQKPEIYNRLKTMQETQQKSIDERYRKLSIELDIVAKQKNYAGAVEILQSITELVPNQADPRHQQAVREMLEYQRQLK
jgi:hypothetical protein